jgi:hypothetical protein
MTDDDHRASRFTTQFDPAPPQGRSKRTSTAHSDAADVSPDMIWLGAVGAWIPQRWCTDRPLVSQLVGEDLGWRLAAADCRARRPGLWRLSTRARWRNESQLLLDKRVRLVSDARELGIVAPAAVAGRSGARCVLRRMFSC